MPCVGLRRGDIQMQADPRFTLPAFWGPVGLRPRSFNWRPVVTSQRLPAKQGQLCSGAQAQSHRGLLDSIAERHGPLCLLEKSTGSFSPTEP